VTELAVFDERLRALVLARVGEAVFADYLSELRIVELNEREVVLAVDDALARQVARSYGAALCAAALELAPGRRVLLHAGEHSYDLSEIRPGLAGAAGAGELGVQPAERMRQRTGKHGQPGVHDRLRAQGTFRVPFSIAASLPRVAEQTPGRHTPGQPVEYRGRYGRSCSPVTLTSFHHRLVLGLLRIAQAGQLGDEGVSCSVNSLLAASFGVCSREQPGYARRVLPALMDLLCCDASLTACYQNDQGRTVITALRELTERILAGVLVRCEDGQLRPVAEIMAWDGERGWWQADCAARARRRPEHDHPARGVGARGPRGPVPVRADRHRGAARGQPAQVVQLPAVHHRSEGERAGAKPQFPSISRV
jgi:hypothetical protein